MSELRRLRKHLHLGQHDLAALAGVHVRTIQRIERGQTRRMHRATRQALLDTLMLDLKMRRARAEGILDPHYEMGQEAKS